MAGETVGLQYFLGELVRFGSRTGERMWVFDIVAFDLQEIVAGALGLVGCMFLIRSGSPESPAKLH